MSVPDHDPTEQSTVPSDNLITVLDEQTAAESVSLDASERVSLYRTIRTAREFDQRMISLQRQGRIETYAPMTGQEGSQVATSFALGTRDWLFPTYREHAAAYAHGVDLTTLIAELRGLCPNRESTRVAPPTIPIATQLPHAVGMAWAATLRDDDIVVLCHFGDGATSEGDFHEALNMAGVFDVPVVFVCNNNQWAISVPRERQTASQTLAQKATAYGFEGIRVDGLDPLAVYSVTQNAIERARSPPENVKRPTLIESVQYRFGAHTTADDPERYREERVANQWRERDPVSRFRNHLQAANICTEDELDTIDEAAKTTVQKAIETAESIEPDPARPFDDVFARPTDRLQAQRHTWQAHSTGGE
ncbi:thiamine pyrophosphate-dependent dehydrogenase E1 component subunit alpha [Halocatena halophila]|uniref:thiamine pyrophosphate-dependent dehydrogenase E1 component subunit alpha n=1 Tax=Halocatena halophila TaxID=2814576 RepID=UPI002ED49048